MIRHPASCEILEPRIAPAGIDPLTPQISADGREATFVDADGDVFVVSTTKGRFTPENFLYLGDAETGRGVLRKIDLSATAFGTAFQGAKIMITLVDFPGDGFADIGWVDATGIDLAGLFSDGDIARIDAGDANLKTPAIQTIEIDAFGANGTALLPEGIADLTSTLRGGAKTIAVSSWLDGRLVATGAGDAATAKFGKIGRLSIGSLTGGEAAGSGSLAASGKVEKLIVQGAIAGGAGDFSASLNAASFGAITVGGGLEGGAGILSGSIFTGDQAPGVLNASGGIASATIQGDLRGAAGPFSGSLITGGKLGPAKLGTFAGGDGEWSGSLIAHRAGKVQAGALFGGAAPSGMYFAQNAVKITLDSITGGTAPLQIRAGGIATFAGKAIGTLEVAGEVENAWITSGLDLAGEGTNGRASLGKLRFGAGLTATSIAAGVHPTDGFFGNEGEGADALIPGRTAKSFAKIALIRVAGSIEGTEAPGDHFGIVAQHIGKFFLADQRQPLSAKTLDTLPLGTQSDFILRELAA
jgi:hypothetical protein